jgi:carbonic anhydrase
MHYVGAREGGVAKASERLRPAYNHLLGECGVVLLATSSLARKYRRGFPKSLDGAPMLLRAATEENVRQTMNDIVAESTVIAELVESGDLAVVGGIHDLATGRVTWLDS